MPDIDFFKFFRYMLAWIVTIYATIITVQSLWGWLVWLAGADRYTSLLRRYLVVHGLRLRIRTFWGDVIVCLLLVVAFALMWRAQVLLDQLEKTHQTAHVQHAIQLP